MPQSPSSFALKGTVLIALLSAYQPAVARTSAAQAAATPSRPAPCETLAAICAAGRRRSRRRSALRPARLSRLRCRRGRRCRSTTRTLPAFCRVAATAAPTPDSAIKFEVWLPVEGWNGKFVAVGNGGFGGLIFYFAMAEPLRRGYAVAGYRHGPRRRAGRRQLRRRTPREARGLRLAGRARDDREVESHRHGALLRGRRVAPTGSAARPGDGRGSRRHSVSLMISTASPLAHPRTTGFR